MIGTDFRLEEVIMTLHVQEARRQAASRAVRSGLQERPHVSRGHEVVRYLGHHLILLGQRLEQYGLPQPSFKPDQLRTGSRRAPMVGN